MDIIYINWSAISYDDSISSDRTCGTMKCRTISYPNVSYHIGSDQIGSSNKNRKTTCTQSLWHILYIQQKSSYKRDIKSDRAEREFKFQISDIKYRLSNLNKKKYLLTLSTQLSVTSKVLRISSLFKKTCFASFMAHPITGMSMISDFERYLNGRGTKPLMTKMSIKEVWFGT